MKNSNYISRTLSGTPEQFATLCTLRDVILATAHFPPIHAVFPWSSYFPSTLSSRIRCLHLVNAVFPSILSSRIRSLPVVNAVLLSILSSRTRCLPMVNAVLPSILSSRYAAFPATVAHLEENRISLARKKHPRVTLRGTSARATMRFRPTRKWRKAAR